MNIFLFKLAVAVTPLVILVGAVVAFPCICRRINRICHCCRRRRRAMLSALVHASVLR